MTGPAREPPSPAPARRLRRPLRPAGPYSEDVSQGDPERLLLPRPFAVAFALLQDLEWDRRLLTRSSGGRDRGRRLRVVGTVEYSSREPVLERRGDPLQRIPHLLPRQLGLLGPNIYGRYLALVIVVAVAPLLWARCRRDLALLAALVAFLWFGLTQTYSESSYLALLAGLALLASLRWNWRWTVGAVARRSRRHRRDRRQPRANCGSTSSSAAAPTWSKAASKCGANGRSGATARAPSRPPTAPTAEQGHPGLRLPHRAGHGRSPSRALIGTAPLRRPHRRQPLDDGRGAWARRRQRARLAVAPRGRLAAFVALLVHTLAYAGFFEDPITWVLLAAGVSLAAAAPREARRDRRRPAAVRDPA